MITYKLEGNSLLRTTEYPKMVHDDNGYHEEMQSKTFDAELTDEDAQNLSEIVERYGPDSLEFRTIAALYWRVHIVEIMAYD